MPQGQELHGLVQRPWPIQGREQDLAGAHALHHTFSQPSSLAFVTMKPLWRCRSMAGLEVIVGGPCMLHGRCVLKATRLERFACYALQAVAELQRRMPNARVLYVSATGATESTNLGYMSRLGLWGPGTAFNSKNDFVNLLQQRGVGAPSGWLGKASCMKLDLEYACSCSLCAVKCMNWFLAVPGLLATWHSAAGRWGFRFYIW